jgi:hypothetical protein
MTKAVVFLTAALAAASLGVVAQEQHTSRNQAANGTSAAQVSGQSSQSTTAGSQVSPATTAAVPSAETAQNARSSASTINRSKSADGNGKESEAARESTAAAQLPQTSTILPLLGLIGLSSLVAGLFARR